MADYTIVFRRSARRELEALPEKLGERILARIRPLAKTPRPSGAKKLKGDFEVLGPITEVATIDRGAGIRELSRLHRMHGRGSWRKLKGVARIRLANGSIRRAELHWYEAHGTS